MPRTMDDVLASTDDPALRRALDALLAARGDDDDADRDRERIRSIARAIERGGGLENAGELTTIELACHDRLLDELRGLVVDAWAAEPAPPEAASMLRLLGAMETVRRSLRADEGQEALVSTLSFVRGPEMVMELAHDFRSPLTSILFLAETLRRGQSGPVSDLQHLQLGIIYSAALSLLSMAGDVTELARAGSRAAEPQATPFSITEVFNSVHDLVSPMIDERKLALRTVPPRDDLRVGYPIALSRVVLNLTTNAIKFTERGFVEVTARELDGTRVEFSVRDTGQGLDAEVRAGLFEPFRTRPTNGRMGLSGTGLGLWICRRLVSMMGGELRFETEPGWGTRFFFELSLPPATGA